jgi:hypothetical protein
VLSSKQTGNKFKVMNKDKLIRATIHKLINEDNCKSIMNLQGIKELPGFENVPDWFFDSCNYTANLIKELRNVILLDKNILTEDQYNNYLSRQTKDSNLNNLID